MYRTVNPNPNRRYRKEPTGKIYGDAPYPGKPQFTKSVDEVGDWNPSVAFQIIKRPQEKCGPRTPYGEFERGANGSVVQKWKKHKRKPRPDDRLNRVRSTPAWCGEAYAAIRGSQAAWDSDGPMMSSYMAMTGDIEGASKKLAVSLHRMAGRDHEPQPAFRENDSIPHGAAPKGRPATPTHDMNVVNGNVDCANATGVGTQLW